MKNNKFMIGVGVVLLLLIIALVVYMMTKKKNAWTDADRKMVLEKLQQKPLFVCSTSSSKSNECLLSKLEDKYDAKTALTIVSGNLGRALNADEVKYFGECMSKECLIETLMAEHTPMGQECATCMVDMALKEANGSAVGAGIKLHDAESLKRMLLACKCTNK